MLDQYTLQKIVKSNAAGLDIISGVTGAKPVLAFDGLTLVAFTVYDYLNGNITFTEAATYNSLFFAGQAGLHALTSKAMIGFALAKGTASTGTAISTLSGAAAKNAAMAYLGKASASVGLSGGVAGGAMVVTAGSAVVATAVIAAGMLAYAKYEDGQENKRYEYFAESLLNGAALTKSVERWGVKGY